MNRNAAALLDALTACQVTPGDSWARLLTMIQLQADSAFGREFGFSSIRTPEDFREALAVSNYEGYRHWIERCANGEAGVLACDEVIGFEKTSGTTSMSKWIPMTRGLQQEFARGLAVWFRNWERRCPEVFDGRAYWAISPPGLASESTAGGLPVGLTGDAAYFPDEIGAKLADWLVIPNLSGEVESVFEETAATLLATPDLSMVSVWSPTFLLGIDAAIRRMRGNFLWSEVWPKLALVSCWADAASEPWVPKLRARLGGIPIEGKGLLATEGITSIPREIDGSPRLAVECHWHEFITEEGDFVPVSDLRCNHLYEVLLTTAGGLYRYRSGDRVRVTGFGRDGFPNLRFMGRSGRVCDLVGEKLHEDLIIEAMGGHGFIVAVPDRPGYDLWLDDAGCAGRVEKALRRNPYLHQALALHQLAPFRIRTLTEDWIQRLSHHMARYRGCRIGDVKPAVLITDIDPEEVASWLD